MQAAKRSGGGKSPPLSKTPTIPHTQVFSVAYAMLPGAVGEAE
jgi:hypothetical protein